MVAHWLGITVVVFSLTFRGKNTISPRKKQKKRIKSGNKTFNQHFGANLKNKHFDKILQQIYYLFCIFSAFLHKKC